MFNNLHELIATMPDEKTCREYLIKERWNGIIVCPYCGCEGAYSIENGKRFKCKSKACYKKFSVTVGTVFEASNIPLNKWFMAIYLTTAHKKGISSYQLGKDIGVAQKSAWFMLHRIRELMSHVPNEKLKGDIELDETYMARKYRSDYKGLKPAEIEFIHNNKFNAKNKGAVVGMVERGNKIRVLTFPENKANVVREAINTHIEEGSRLLTDESNLYKAGLENYKHDTVTHTKREWVRGDVHTNNVENFWSVMKRGVHGIYHQISYKHLQRYCDEYSYRYNSRKIKDKDRFVNSLQQIEGRLTYKKLVGKE